MKQNNISFRRERREKYQKARTNQRMRGIINRMADAGGTAKEIGPIVHLARAFDDEIDYNTDYSDDASHE